MEPEPEESESGSARAHGGEELAARAPRRPSAAVAILAGTFLALAIGILVAGSIYSSRYEAHFRSEVERQLSAIAELKVVELSKFRRERLDNGNLLLDNFAFARDTVAFLARPHDAEITAALFARLERLQRIYDYDRVSLVDPQGRDLLSAPASGAPLPSAVARRLPDVLSSPKAIMIDFFRAEEDRQVYLTVGAAVLDPTGRGPAIAAVILRIDPDRSLNSFLESWPIPSETAESLLVRREGDRVVFLNELRFRKGTALSLEIPLERTEVPAVRAALGEATAMKGIDYRGVPVLAAIRQVPDSPWALVAKTNVAEAMAPARERRELIAFLMGALILSAAAGTGAAWRFQKGRADEAALRAARALQESEAKYRSLFESMAEGVALHEMIYGDDGEAVDYRILDINPAYEWHTGLAPERARGARASELYGGAPAPYLAEYDRVVRTAQPFTFETYFPPLKRHFSISAVRQGPGQFATVFDDITRRKNQEEELRTKNAELERFTYLVSHDLKSPLVTVKTFLGYLDEDLREQNVPRIETDLSYLHSATEKMGRLLEDLLELSRVGRVTRPPVDVRLSELIADASEAVAGQIARSGVEIRAEAADLVLHGDRTRLYQIWQNLLENSVKYMGDQPSPRIEIGVKGNGRESVFRVKDNGIGIDPRFHGRVFGLFEKLDPGTEGTGLGLALVKRVVELHGGRIWLESEGAATGTSIFFTLPDAIKDLSEGAPT